MAVHDNRSFACLVRHGNLFMRAGAAPPEWPAAEVLMRPQQVHSTQHCRVGAAWLRPYACAQHGRALQAAVRFGHITTFAASH